ncbi:MAG: hypothetical protein JKY17_07240 [Magnetovibrio sp.]|nr:hypothetical protein [Magnetovibrio sp.]
MARKPNYGFERKERDRLKAEKKAKRAALKSEAAENTAKQSEQLDTEDQTTPTE